MKMNKIQNRKTWTDKDNTLIHNVYRFINDEQKKGHKVNKAKLFRELGEKLGRSKSSCECKAMNISAIYQNLLNKDYATGLKPLNNYNHSLAKNVCNYFGVDYEK